jgi:hypothetical protein
VFGLGLGVLAALYGLVAFAMGRTFLPGLPGEAHTVTGPGATALAGGYLAGGLYLLCRFFLQERLPPRDSRPSLYVLQNVLLAGFIACLVYLLVNMGEVR